MCPENTGIVIAVLVLLHSTLHARYYPKSSDSHHSKKIIAFSAQSTGGRASLDVFKVWSVIR